MVLINKKILQTYYIINYHKPKIVVEAITLEICLQIVTKSTNYYADVKPQGL
jgi:hypothetical protein